MDVLQSGYSGIVVTVCSGIVVYGGGDSVFGAKRSNYHCILRPLV